SSPSSPGSEPTPVRGVCAEKSSRGGEFRGGPDVVRATLSPVAVTYLRTTRGRAGTWVRPAGWSGVGPPAAHGRGRRRRTWDMALRRTGWTKGPPLMSPDGQKVRGRAWRRVL